MIEEPDGTVAFIRLQKRKTYIKETTIMENVLQMKEMEKELRCYNSYK